MGDNLRQAPLGAANDTPQGVIRILQRSKARKRQIAKFSSRIDGFFVSVLDSLAHQIAVIDAEGTIQWVNASWKTFARDNGCQPDIEWLGVNYLHVCRRSAGNGAGDGSAVLAGIERVINGEQAAFYFEYDCHSPTEQRWFMMTVRPLDWDGPSHFVVTHHDITERKLSELHVEQRAVIDSLTGVANRRRFDEFLETEWRRARRNRYPLSLVLFDVDFFKAYNDTYGHWAGDDCLRRVGEVLRLFSRRADDLMARYGGEEFGLILSNTSDTAAFGHAESVRAAIEALNVRHIYGKNGRITISGGVATWRPEAHPDATPADLIAAADTALYRAKQSGRNRMRADTSNRLCKEPEAAAGH